MHFGQWERSAPRRPTLSSDRRRRIRGRSAHGSISNAHSLRTKSGQRALSRCPASLHTHTHMLAVKSQFRIRIRNRTPTHTHTLKCTQICIRVPLRQPQPPILHGCGCVCLQRTYHITICDTSLVSRLCVPVYSHAVKERNRTHTPCQCDTLWPWASPAQFRLVTGFG